MRYHGAAVARVNLAGSLYGAGTGAGAGGGPTGRAEGTGLGGGEAPPLKDVCGAGTLCTG